MNTDLCDKIKNVSLYSFVYLFTMLAKNIEEDNQDCDD